MSKISFFSLIATLLVLMSSCANNQTIGGSIQPESDKVSTDTMTLAIVSQTRVVDSILQKNSKALLGEFTDPDFGTTQAEFMAQFYCPHQFEFPQTAQETDSAFLYLFFDEWFGDSSSLFETSVYPLSKPLDMDQAYYTNISTEEYCDKSRKLGTVSHTIQTSGNQWTSAYNYCIRIKLDTDFARQFMRDNREHPEYFDGPIAFADYFKGLYIANSYGNGAILYITYAELEFCYNYSYTHPLYGERDTIGAVYFPITKEVKQVNQYKHPDLNEYLPVNDTKDSLNYIYSPAGMFTSISIPMEKIMDALSDKSINSARLTLSAADLKEQKWGMQPPGTLLLLKDQDIHQFFADYCLADNLYSFTADYNRATESYTFDLSQYVQKMVRYHDGNDTGIRPFTEMLLVPAEKVTNKASTLLYLLMQTTPSAVKIKSGNHPTQAMKLELVFTRQGK